LIYPAFFVAGGVLLFRVRPKRRPKFEDLRFVAFSAQKRPRHFDKKKFADAFVAFSPVQAKQKIRGLLFKEK
jgi:hypothetical protein